jgi:hypothetical protein
MRKTLPIAILLALSLIAPASAQSKVKTEAVAPKAAEGKAQTDTLKVEAISDLSRLPEKVRQTRTRILEAAKSGDLNKVATVMQSNEMMPVFSFGGEKNPVEFWKASYPDSDGIEALAILSELLEMPFVHLDKGTPQEMYVWPYFYAVPLASLTLEQKVELFRLVTGADWKEMLDFGAYIFFRVGIAPDGVWHFYVAGD